MGHRPQEADEELAELAESGFAARAIEITPVS